MQNGRKVQNSPTILLLSQLLYNVNLMTLACMSVFFSKKTQQGVYAAEEVKEKTQTESKQKACMGMEMEMEISSQSGKS